MEELPRPIPAAGEVLIQVKAAAINPSDVKNVQGKMHETSLPRIPGRDFAGIVVEGPGDLSGQLVFGSGGNLGFGRERQPRGIRRGSSERGASTSQEPKF